MKSTLTLLLTMLAFNGFSQQGDGVKKSYKTSINLKELTKINFPQPDIQA